LAAGITDLWKFRVYNLLTVPLLVSGIIFHSVSTDGQGLTASLLGALFGLAVLMPFCLLGGMGAGDVKLLAGVGAWLGVPVTFVVFMVSGLVGALYALAVIAVRGRARETWFNLAIIWHRVSAIGKYLGSDDQLEIVVDESERRMQLIPFGVMIACGVMILVVLVWLR
jgi:prepilin peptidase CpaA